MEFFSVLGNRSSRDLDSPFLEEFSDLLVAQVVLRAFILNNLLDYFSNGR